MTDINVLLLTIDSLRYDGVFTEEFETPTFDQLADTGVTFDSCYSQGISTAPSMTAILTGRYPLDYGGHWYLEESQPTMAEEFRRNGYATGAIHSNPNVSRLRNFHRGFETFEENILPYDPDGLVTNAPDDLLRYANKVARILRRTPYKPAGKINASLLSWIQSREEPWFLWTQYMDVHGPYLPGDEFSYRNKFKSERLWRKAAVTSPDEVTKTEHEELRRNYKKEVEYLDAEIGRFLDELNAEGKLANTAVVIVSDHGDEFFEHGRYGHGNLPYDELTHVPLIVRFPEFVDVPQPTTVNELVRTIDVLPTMLDLVNADLSAEMEARMVGNSLLPVIRGDKSGCDCIVTEKEMRGETALRFGFRTDQWKYIYDGKTDDHLLYDLGVDPSENRNVAADNPEIVDRFRDRLQARLDSIEETSSSVQIPDLEDGEGVSERLRALGYK
ncbi:sulfatase [Halomicroarcula sp. GCM10025817]|uniref:sulfatase n=1 Tax=Haloarcula TaxID=2237 RepID=UPI0023E8E601|nr:sulfatase [Halomicroarcula sp. SYNS111]